ncbi:Uncharacterized protein SCF082_LOCUS33102, partial [Durusdinium trenchii]
MRRPNVEGELFVPFTVLPGQGASQESALGIRFRSVEGLPDIGTSRLMIGFRFGTLDAEKRVDKSKEASVKTQFALVRQGETWAPENAGLVRVVLPNSLVSLASKGIICRLKV